MKVEFEGPADIVLAEMRTMLNQQWLGSLYNGQSIPPSYPPPPPEIEIPEAAPPMAPPPVYPAVLEEGGSDAESTAAAEQRLAEVAAQPLKRARRTKAEMEAARMGDYAVYQARLKAEAAAQEAAIDAALGATAAAIPASEEAALVGDKPASGPGSVDLIVTESATDEAKAAFADEPPTFEAMKNALRRVLEKDGLGPTGGRKLLEEAGAKKLSDIPQSDWGAFVAKCDRAVRG